MDFDTAAGSDPARAPRGMPSNAWRHALAAWAVVFVALLCVYSPALTGQFLWDDDAHVTKPELRSLSGLARIWFDVGATQQYYPLLHSAFWIEHQLWGDRSAGLSPGESAAARHGGLRWSF